MLQKEKKKKKKKVFSIVTIIKSRAGFDLTTQSLRI